MDEIRYSVLSKSVFTLTFLGLRSVAEDLLLGVLLVIEFMSGRFKDEEEDN